MPEPDIYDFDVRHGDRLWEAEIPRLGKRADGFISEAAAQRWISGLFAQELLRRDIQLAELQEEHTFLTCGYAAVAQN